MIVYKQESLNDQEDSKLYSANPENKNMHAKQRKPCHSDFKTDLHNHSFRTIQIQEEASCQYVPSTSKINGEKIQYKKEL
jgi:hypothetical protein